mmetsp:Transcript_20485/g.31596  ORF Transcript_20485/g.31596 Transcript_20485/m.31596 type:complete len:393 (+) Transcript_20485:55-1233(+)
MGFFDDLKAAAIEKVKEKVKEELAELGIDLDEDEDDADIDEALEPEPEEIAAGESSPPAQDDDGGERPVSAWSTPLNVTTSSPPSAPAVASSNYSPSTSFPSPDADTTFNEAVQKLWDLDARLIPNQDYKIDVQSSKHPCNKEDAADEPLFTYVKPAVFRKRPTFTTFVALLNNYSTYTGEEEDVTEQELQENRAFLNEVMKTAPMKYCHQYCIAKGCTYKGKEISGSESEFKRILNSIWFELYSRSGRRNMDSSGFEHVFVGEVKNGQVSGFHNWIMFYLEEKRGNVDFRGYIKPKCRDSSTAETNDDDPVLTLQFRWNGVEKFVGTCFIGVTPEFEMALYTMAFLASDEDENVITLDAGGEMFDLNVKCHKYDRNTKVGSCYVEALAHYE